MILLLAFLGVSGVSADAVVGDTIVTLGENLSDEEKEAILKDMGVDEDDITILYVSNEEEHQYLGDYISASQIGTRALSSSMIVLQESGYGINVVTNNIDRITEEMYANALVTAGVEDADVYVTAPFEVSGTAGLTGLIKAYEEAMDIEISEEQKQVANEEVVVTSELADEVENDEEATELINAVKEELADNPDATEDEIRTIIINVSNDKNIELSDDSINKLVNLFTNMQKAGIDWDGVKSGLNKVKTGVQDFINSDEAQNFFAKAWSAIMAFFAWVGNWFSGLFS